MYNPPFLQVIKLDLRYNDLTTLPPCLLELPSLQQLNLSHNKVTEIPDIPEWSSAITDLDLSNNQLQSLPMTTVASLRALNLSHNQFCQVPTCICSFTALHSLDLSDNPGIHALPAEMGKLTSLTPLNLRNLRDLKEPPRNVQRNARDTTHYLISKLCCPKELYRMKVMVLGMANRGKSTLVARLLDNEYVTDSTIGLDIFEWQYQPGFGKRPFHFSIWDFGGQDEYYIPHTSVSSPRTLSISSSLISWTRRREYRS